MSSERAPIVAILHRGHAAAMPGRRFPSGAPGAQIYPCCPLPTILVLSGNDVSLSGKLAAKSAPRLRTEVPAAGSSAAAALWPPAYIRPPFFPVNAITV